MAKILIDILCPIINALCPLSNIYYYCTVVHNHCIMDLQENLLTVEGLSLTAM
jgi:hypothetical protein